MVPCPGKAKCGAFSSLEISWCNPSTRDQFEWWRNWQTRLRSAHPKSKSLGLSYRVHVGSSPTHSTFPRSRDGQPHQSPGYRPAERPPPALALQAHGLDDLCYAPPALLAAPAVHLRAQAPALAARALGDAHGGEDGLQLGAGLLGWLGCCRDFSWSAVIPARLGRSDLLAPILVLLAPCTMGSTVSANAFSDCWNHGMGVMVTNPP